MPRVNVKRQFEKIVSVYVENKEHLDSLKKMCDADNKEIKKMLPTLVEEQDGKWVYDTPDGIKVTVNTTKKESLNEEKLLEVIKKSGIEVDGLVKTKEYVDLDVLETAMYAQLIGHDLMLEIDKCREVKETQVLTVKR